MNQTLTTRRGPIPLPCILPVTTAGDAFPVDRLVRPYLPRLAPAALMSYHYAKPLRERPGDRPACPLFIDSGGFSLLLPGSTWEPEADGGGRIRSADGEVTDRMSVLNLQLEHAEVAATLDLPVPPDLDHAEAQRRQEASIVNARWTLQNTQRPDLRLFAALPCWDEASAATGARRLAELSVHGRHFDGIGIGGLVPRLRDAALVERLVRAVRNVWAGPIHAFGVGSPEMVHRVVGWGATSTDSSSYIRQAVDGRCVLRGQVLESDQRTPLAIMRLALRNLVAVQDPALVQFPLSCFDRLRVGA
jgi:tRNA-guanine family transglycosylase